MIARIVGDFSGLFGDYLCISHSETARTHSGDELTLTEGLELLAFEPDIEDGEPCFLVARGRAVRSPPEMCGYGSRWALRIDESGVRHVRTLDEA
jgi:hypothetical protein